MNPVQLYPISPKLTATDFRDVDLLYETILKALPEKKTDADETVLVFPEYFGLGFFIAQGGEAALKARSIPAAMGELIRKHLGRVAWHFFKTYLDFFVGPADQRFKRAIFQTYAPDVWLLYRALFSNLAEAHQSWVVAGSILMPELVPGGKNGWGIVGDQLYNQSVVFNPNGEIAGVVTKIHLTPEEAGFVNAGSLEKWRPIQTGWGKLAVMICADCWYPELYSRSLQYGATHYAVPAMVSPNTAWSSPWRGYKPKASTPADIPPELVGQISEAEAWERFGLVGRLKNIRHAGGVISQFQGAFLDLTATGESQVIL